MEQISIQRLQLLHPKARESGLAAYSEAVKRTPVGVHPFVLETLRSFERSNELYAQGRTRPGSIVTNAKAGESYHNYGLAFDCMNQVNGEVLWKVDKNFLIVVDIFKAHGWTWGGDFRSIKDTPHFELTFGHNWRDLLIKHNAGQVDENGYVII